MVEVGKRGVHKMAGGSEGRRGETLFNHSPPPSPFLCQVLHKNNKNNNFQNFALLKVERLVYDLF